MAEPKRFTHRWVSGWISDFSSTPRWDPWPSITLENRLEADLREAFAYAQTAGYSGVILWGMLAGRSWNPCLPDTVSPERKRKVLEIMEVGRSHGLKILMGLGLYSWGFEAIIAEHPEVDGGSPTTMCGNRTQSWEWMQRVIDYIMDEFDPDGVSMQSSDQGRCPCDACQELSSLEYHAMLNDRAASYIRSRWPGKLIGISTWGMDLGNPGERASVVKMTEHVDVLNDFNNSSARGGRQNRRDLARSLICAFGAEQGFWLDPSPFWDRLKWFLPFSLCNLPYWKDLHTDGGRAIERYILPLANPGAEVGFLFDGWMLQDLERDPEKTLLEGLERVYAPRTRSAGQALLEIWRTAEAGFLEAISHPDTPRQIGSNSIHYTHHPPSYALANRPEYLLQMKAINLPRYAGYLRACLAIAQKTSEDWSCREKAARLEGCIRLALRDVEWVMA